MIDPTRPVQVHTLDEARVQRDAWRSKPQRGRRFPDALWDAAVRFGGEHSVCRVSLALGLDDKALRRRHQAAQVSEPMGPFFPLGPLSNQVPFRTATVALFLPVPPPEFWPVCVAREGHEPSADLLT